MASYKAPNSAMNITLLAALAFIAQLNKLGLMMGGLFVNLTGAEPTDYIPVADAADLPQDDPANLLVMANGDFHNVAMLSHMFHGGTLAGFRSVAVEIGKDPDSAALSIPGATAALEKLISTT